MSLLPQQLLVGALVGACALYSAWRLASVRLRLRLLDALAALPGGRRLAWLRSRILGQATLACGGCSTPGAASNRTPGAPRR